MERVLKLYPGNWLYNASVIGFLKVIAYGIGEEKVDSWLKEDGSVEVDKEIFEAFNIGKISIPISLMCYVKFLTRDEDFQDWIKKYRDKKEYQSLVEIMGDFAYNFARAGNKLFMSKMPYQNLVQSKEWRSLEFAKFVSRLSDLQETNTSKTCSICGRNTAIEPNISSNLEKRLFNFGLTHSSLLGPSGGKFPNSLWNQKISLSVCPLCAYLIIHHHISFIKMGSNEEIFINAPSFKVMWHLNKLVAEVYAKSEVKEKRELLGMTLIEMVTRLYMQLGIWTSMNIEIVSKYSNNIDFFSLPYETVHLLINKEIASMLSQIGELRVLNLILDGKYTELLNFGEKIMNIGLKPAKERSKNERDFIDENIKLERNRGNLIDFSYKTFKLYSLLEAYLKSKREVHYESV